MVSGLMPARPSDRYAKTPDDDTFHPDDRYWWCPDCGAVFQRHYKERRYKFCANCDWRDAVLIEMKPIGPGADEIHRSEGADHLVEDAEPGGVRE